VLQQCDLLAIGMSVWKVFFKYVGQMQWHHMTVHALIALIYHNSLEIIQEIDKVSVEH